MVSKLLVINNGNRARSVSKTWLAALNSLISRAKIPSVSTVIMDIILELILLVENLRGAHPIRCI
jgi:hypothetical protein